MSRIKYDKLSRDKPDTTKIIAGKEEIPISELEKRDSKSDVKKKLTSLEDSLEKLLIVIFIALYQ